MSRTAWFHHILSRGACRRAIALIQLVVVLSVSVAANCHDIGPKKAGIHTTVAVSLPIPDTHESPCCPVDDDHSDVDHCASCLHCACNALLADQETVLSYAPSVSMLNPIDRFNHLPEVYLPKFIPPQNHA
jgi:hypothetical protein